MAASRGVSERVASLGRVVRCNRGATATTNSGSPSDSSRKPECQYSQAVPYVTEGPLVQVASLLLLVAVQAPGRQLDEIPESKPGFYLSLFTHKKDGSCCSHCNKLVTMFKSDPTIRKLKASGWFNHYNAEVWHFGRFKGQVGRLPTIIVQNPAGRILLRTSGPQGVRTIVDDVLRTLRRLKPALPNPPDVDPVTPDEPGPVDVPVVPNQPIPDIRPQPEFTPENIADALMKKYADKLIGPQGNPGDPGVPGNDAEVDGLRRMMQWGGLGVGGLGGLGVGLAAWSLLRKRPSVKSIASELIDKHGDRLRGPQGDPGRDGTNGRDGTDGQNGTDGRDGTNGNSGRDGSDGSAPSVDEIARALATQYADYLRGPAGHDGRDGRDGTFEPTLPISSHPELRTQQQRVEVPVGNEELAALTQAMNKIESNYPGSSGTINMINQVKNQILSGNH